MARDGGSAASGALERSGVEARVGLDGHTHAAAARTCDTNDLHGAEGFGQAAEPRMER